MFKVVLASLTRDELPLTKSWSYHGPMLALREFKSRVRIQVVGVRRYAKMARDYNAAVAALNTLQSNFSVVDAIRKSGRGMNKNAIPEMIDWVRQIGYEVCVIPRPWYV